eukprot:COSAG04_NODE_224_length_19624_cov_47.932855_5_plen_187_part_00
MLAAIDELQKLHGVESYKLELTAEEKLERQTAQVRKPSLSPHRDRHAKKTTSHHNRCAHVRTESKQSLEPSTLLPFRVLTIRLDVRSRLQIGKIVRDAIASNRSLGGKAMKNIESTFKAIDKDGSGDLDHGEFTTAMNRLGLGLSEEQIDQCIEVTSPLPLCCSLCPCLLFIYGRDGNKFPWPGAG